MLRSLHRSALSERTCGQTLESIGGKPSPSFRSNRGSGRTGCLRLRQGVVALLLLGLAAAEKESSQSQRGSSTSSESGLLISSTLALPRNASQRASARLLQDLQSTRSLLSFPATASQRPQVRSKKTRRARSRGDARTFPRPRSNCDGNRCTARKLGCTGDHGLSVEQHDFAANASDEQNDGGITKH